MKTLIAIGIAALIASEAVPDGNADSRVAFQHREVTLKYFRDKYFPGQNCIWELRFVNHNGREEPCVRVTGVY